MRGEWLEPVRAPPPRAEGGGDMGRVAVVAGIEQLQFPNALLPLETAGQVLCEVGFDGGGGPVDTRHVSVELA